MPDTEGVLEMAAPKKGGSVSIGRSATSGRFTQLQGAAKASSSAVATLRASRTAEIASALKQANRKTGLFTKK